MAAAPLNLTPALQPWYLAGLTCLLLDEDTASLVREAGVISGKPTTGASEMPDPDGGGKLTVQDSHFAAPTAVTPGMQRPVTPAKADPKTVDLTKLQVANLDMDITSQIWPQHWQSLLAKMQPAPIAWTYPELGEDLLLAGCKERSAALREIISRLRLPRGSSTFWPARLPAAQSLQETYAPEQGAAPDCFRAGLRILNVRFLIAFGPDALAGTFYEAFQLKPFSEQISDGRLILALPSFASLLSMPGRLDKVVLFLDSVLSRFLRT